ncbi:hypothetical protein BLNAU_4734 [Blattamonas nauphoetae]|uniref:F-box domain-containing protein n=1 Tax=Blattamonas nauphoetae TaxID=2049346 RepID=A0ABQ9Y8U8_9EUKA|nr:hypothetical protein BLNAU_4734 [Blattamonas nauphoetae]
MAYVENSEKDSTRAGALSEVELEQFPDHVLSKIFSNCDYETLKELNVTCLRFSKILEDDQLWTKGALEELERKQSTFRHPDSEWSSLSEYNPRARQYNNKTYFHSFGISKEGPLVTIALYDRLATNQQTVTVRKGRQITKKLCGNTVPFVFYCLGVITVVALCGVGFAGWGFAMSATHYDYRTTGILDDKIMTSTHWFGFIPYSLAIIGLFGYLIFLACSKSSVFGVLAFTVLISSASYVLAILKFDGLEFFWIFSMMPFLVMIPVAVPALTYVVSYYGLGIRSSKWKGVAFGLVFAAYYVVTPAILISDNILPWNYHLSMIPLYLAYAIVSIIVLIRTFRQVKDHKSFMDHSRKERDTEKQMSGAQLYKTIVEYLKEE